MLVLLAHSQVVGLQLATIPRRTTATQRPHRAIATTDNRLVVTRHDF